MGILPSEIQAAFSLVKACWQEFNLINPRYWCEVQLTELAPIMGSLTCINLPQNMGPLSVDILSGLQDPPPPPPSPDCSFPKAREKGYCTKGPTPLVVIVIRQQLIDQLLKLQNVWCLQLRFKLTTSRKYSYPVQCSHHWVMPPVHLFFYFKLHIHRYVDQIMCWNYFPLLTHHFSIIPFTM